MTWHILGQEEVMICMAYFPVIFKASHLKELREYLIKRFKATDFDDFFLHQLFDNNSLCQFNIMCNFMWYFKNDEYTWRVHDLTPDWDGITPPPNFGQWSMRYIFPVVNGLIPKPMVFTHARYRYWNSRIAFEIIDNPYNMNRLLIHGLCHTLPTHTTLLHRIGFSHLNCSVLLNVNKYFDEAYKFEDANFASVANESVVSEMITLHDERINRFKHCDMSFLETGWLNHFHNIDVFSVDELHKLLLGVR